jgi:hypothetical protein
MMKWLDIMTGRRHPPVPEDRAWPPLEWKDIEGWDRYHEFEKSDGLFGVPASWRQYQRMGDRLWFPGCGISGQPRLYSLVGYKVLATDFSPTAVEAQRSYASVAPEDMFEYWAEFSSANGPFADTGSFDVAEHDFVTGTAPGIFDVVINNLAFQGLSPSAKAAAATTFFDALRPEGLATFLTMNIGETAAREELEGSLTAAGFCLGMFSFLEAPKHFPGRKVAEICYGSG